MRIGSLFSGYGGLDMAVGAVTGGETVWVSDIDPGACKILAHHWPAVPNLGDIAKVDWSAVEPVDVVTGGFPCQDVSHAGKRAGLRPDTRTGLWSQMAYAIDQLRPSLVVAENVRGLLSAEAHGDLEPCPWCVGDGPAGALRALGAVLGDLADLGYDAQWTGLRAADVGAPHGRFRVFVVAYPAGDPWRLSNGDPSASVNARHGTGSAEHWHERDTNDGTWKSGPRAAADADELGHERAGSARGRRPGLADDGLTAADASGDGRDEGRPESARLVGRPDAPERSAAHPDAAGIRCGTEGRDDRLRPQGLVESPAPDAERCGCAGGPCDPLRCAQRRAAAARSGEAAVGGVVNDGTHERPGQGGSREVLPDVRRADGAEAVQRQTRGQDPVPVSEELFAGVREQPSHSGQERTSLAGETASGDRVPGLRSDDRSARTPQGPEPDERRPVEPGDALRELSPEAALAGGSREPHGSDTAWGPYEAAIRRWEHVLGRPAPPPTETGAKGGQRLSPIFVEWLMGLPAGHVTAVPGLTRNEQLKALGNGVVPQQAAAAITHLLQALECAA